MNSSYSMGDASCPHQRLRSRDSIAAIAVFAIPSRRSISASSRVVRSLTSVALHVDELPQRVTDLHEVGGVGHHLVDVLVCRRNLVDELVGVAVLDALHGLA